MNKISLISAITLLLGLQSSPILLHAQVVQTTADYHPFYLDAVKYDSTTGVIAVNPDYDATDKVVIKNDSVSLSTLSYHYIHFWDDAGTYLGHYATSGAESCSNACIGEINTSDIPLPLGAYSYAVERFDRDDADYEVTSGVTLSDLFDQSSIYNLVGDNSFNGYITYNNIGVLDFFASTSTVIADNLILNGDFSVDSNSDGLGDFWNSVGTINRSIISGVQKAFANGSSYIPSINQNKNISFNNTYYLRSTFNTNNTTQNKTLRINKTTGYQDIYSTVSNPGTRSDVFTLTSYNSVYIEFFINGYTGPATPPPDTDYLEVSIVMLVNLTTLVNQGLIASATVSAFETWLTNNTDISVGQYFDDIKRSNYDGVWKTYYLLWSDNTIGGLETIDQQYYLNGDRKEIYDLTTLFGAGSEPNLATMQGYYTDYDALFDYSYISPLAWAVAPTYTVTYWDDQVEDAISGGFMLAASIAVTFILMMIGFTKRAKLFNLFAIAGAVWFTIQAGASLPIIIVGFGLIVINALYFAKEGD